jgi:hypothetical protein
MNERERERKRGDGWLFQQPGSRYWYMGYFVDGKQVRASTKNTDREAAQAVLDRTLEDVRRGEATPQEHRLKVGDLWDLLRINYEVNKRRSRSTVGYVFKHVIDYFGAKTKAIRLTSDRLERYVQQRQTEDAAIASINMELALIGRAFTLAVRARRVGPQPGAVPPEAGARPVPHPPGLPHPSGG